MSSRKLTKPRRYTIELEAREVPLIIKTHATSRRMILRYCGKKEAVMLTLPKRVSLREGLAFAHSRKAWLLKQIATQPARIMFADGINLPVMGEMLMLRHVAEKPPYAWREGEILYIGGSIDGVSRRVRNWLIRQAREVMSARARMHAAAVGKRIRTLRIADTTSSWGSCTARETVSLSWRLLLAPPHVMEYVICHEVAHLVELNHSRRFWALVARLCPHYEMSRAWLSAHGQRLHAYG